MMHSAPMASPVFSARANEPESAIETPEAQASRQDPATSPDVQDEQITTKATAEAEAQTDAPQLPPQPYAEYIPRPQLSIAPVPRAPILIAPPQDDKEAARRVIVLSLYIDETGHVRHIEADHNDLPLSYVQAAREAFMAATFSPGQLEGQQVKSRTRVEVVFDNTPLDSGPSTGPSAGP